MRAMLPLKMYPFTLNFVRIYLVCIKPRRKAEKLLLPNYVYSKLSIIPCYGESHSENKISFHNFTQNYTEQFYVLNHFNIRLLRATDTRSRGAS